MDTISSLQMTDFIGRIHISLLGLLLAGCFATQADNGMEEPMNERPEYAMAIHGGAGVITKANMSDEREAAYLASMHKALDIGEKILKEGGSAIDAVVATVISMEDDSLFNAGRGSVFTHEGINEMDASIMDGTDLNAGAVGGVTNLKNPILAARAVLEASDHVMLSGKGAEQFAVEQGLETVDGSYFRTGRRWKSLQNLLKEDPESTELDHADSKHGTVGAVALDRHGNLAAATSTGGMTNKKYNRIGDSPIIGAGTYANNQTCAVSSTGHGEYFIRYAVAHAISAQMEYGDKTLSEAGDHVIHKQLVDAGGTGGVISVDKYGNVHMPFNTEGMYRGYITPDQRVVKIYGE